LEREHREAVVKEVARRERERQALQEKAQKDIENKRQQILKLEQELMEAYQRTQACAKGDVPSLKDDPPLFSKTTITVSSQPQQMGPQGNGFNRSINQGPRPKLMGPPFNIQETGQSNIHIGQPFHNGHSLAMSNQAPIPHPSQSPQHAGYQQIPAIPRFQSPQYPGASQCAVMPMPITSHAERIPYPHPQGLQEGLPTVSMPDITLNPAGASNAAAYAAPQSRSSAEQAPQSTNRKRTSRSRS